MDRGKKGSKIHLITDRAGLPLSIAISGANTPEIRAAWECRSCMRAFAVTFLGQLRRSDDTATPAGGADRKSVV